MFPYTIHTPQPAAEPALPLAEFHDRRIRAAATRAGLVLPPALATMVSRELHAMADMTFLPMRDTVMARVIVEIETMPVPGPG